MTESHNPEGWTFATLYVHFNERFTAAKEAISKVENATEKRFESVNEFRNALRDQQSTFADKEATDRRLAVLEESRNKNDGKTQGVNSIVLAGATAVSILIALAALFLRH